MWGLGIVKMNKKGFAVMFSWVFSVLAGIIIFLSLVYFAVQHTDLFGKISEQVAVEELDIAFASLKSSLIGTTLELDKPIKLEFKCGGGTDFEEKLFVNGIAGKTLRGKIIFAPEESNSYKFNIFTLDWNAPFKITNFIFLTDKHYNFIDLPEVLRNKIPDNIKSGTQNIGVNFEFAEDLGTINSCVYGDKKVYYKYDDKLEEYYGKICIGDTNPYPFVGTAFIFAAIFSDQNNFKCLYDLAVEKSKDIAKIYAKKLENIECRNELTKEEVEGLDVKNLYNVGIIAERNDNLLRRGECESLY